MPAPDEAPASLLIAGVLRDTFVTVVCRMRFWRQIQTPRQQKFRSDFRRHHPVISAEALKQRLILFRDSSTGPELNAISLELLAGSPLR